MRRLIFYIVSVCISLSCYSQDSLIHYLEIAARNNPTVLQRYNEYNAALQKVPQVSSLPDPQLDLSFYVTPEELVAGNEVADIKLMQMFPWFGVIKNAKDEMSLMAKAKFETFRDAKLQVYYDTQRIWFDLYKVRQNIKITEKNTELLKTIERLTLAKYKSGSSTGNSSASVSRTSSGNYASTLSSGNSGMNTMGGKSGSKTDQPPVSGQSGSMSSSSGATSLTDVYQIQIELSELENSLSSLKNEEQVVVARFNNLLNRPQNMSVSEVYILQREPLDVAYLTVKDSMFLRNPMLGMLQYERQSLEARRKMQKQMGFPMVGVGVNYLVINKSAMSTSTMNGVDMIMPMVVLTLPIYRNKYKAMQAESRYLKAASEQNYKSTANALQTDYYEAIQLYNDAQRRMKLYDNQSQLARKSLDIMIKSFSSSGSNLTDILRVRQQLLDYEFKQVEGLTDFNKAEAWIKRLTPNP